MEISWGHHFYLQKRVIKLHLRLVRDFRDGSCIWLLQQTATLWLRGGRVKHRCVSPDTGHRLAFLLIHALGKVCHWRAFESQEVTAFLAFQLSVHTTKKILGIYVCCEKVQHSWNSTTLNALTWAKKRQLDLKHTNIHRKTCTYNKYNRNKFHSDS